jgi:hypothetical protein
MTNEQSFDINFLRIKKRNARQDNLHGVIKNLLNKNFFRVAKRIKKGYN